MRTTDLLAYLDSLFQFQRWTEMDGNASGLEVAYVALAVDTGLAAIFCGKKHPLAERLGRDTGLATTLINLPTGL